jgi:hypothetical protein
MSPLPCSRFGYASALCLSLFSLLSLSCARQHGARDRHTRVDSGVEQPEADDFPDDAAELGPDADQVPDADAALDARDRVDADVDAAPGLADGSAQDAGSDAGDAAAFPDLVFTQRTGRMLSLHTLSAGDFGSIRSLGSFEAEPAQRAWPLGYTPDAQKLFIASHARELDGYAIAYPCRAEPCPALAARYAEVFTTPPRNLGNDPPLEPQFAPDSSGVALVTPNALWYVGFFSGGPRAVRLSENHVSDAQFVGAGEALIALVADRPKIDANDPPGRLTMFDLRELAQGNVKALPLGHASAAHPFAVQVLLAPDRQHFTVRLFEPHAFSVRELLAGNLQGRRIGSVSAWVEHVSNERIVFVDEPPGALAQRWDGSDTLELPILRSSGFKGCDKHLVGTSEAGFTVLELPGAEQASAAPSVRIIPELAYPSQGPLFNALCTHAELSIRDHADALLDLDSLELTFDDTIDYASLSPDATFLHGGGFGVRRIDRVDGAARITLAYAPRTPFRAPYALAHHSPFLVGGVALEDVLSPNLYQLDLSTPGPAVVRRLIEPPVSIGSVVISPDDRFAAFSTRTASVPGDLGAERPGIYDVDLRTRARQLLTPISADTDQNLGLMQLPATRAFLVSAAQPYSFAGSPALFVANLNEPGGWRSQVLAERAGWPMAQYPGLTLSADGSLVATVSVGPRGPTLSVLRLARTQAEQPALVASVTGDASEFEHASDSFFQVAGFAAELGLIFQRQPPPRMRLTGPRSLWPERIDLATGEVRVLGAPRDARYIAVQTPILAGGRVLITSTSAEGSTSLHFVDPRSPDQTLEIATNAALGPVSPDGRFLVYSVAIDSQRSDLFLYDLERLQSRALLRGDRTGPLSGEQGSVVAFEPAREALLLRSHAGVLYRVPLSRPDDPAELFRGLSENAALSMDDSHTRFCWASFGQDPAFYVDLARSSVPVRVRDGTREPSFLRISPDGSSLLARFGDLTLWRLDPDQLSRAPRPLVDSYGYEPSFDPSGKYLLQTDWNGEQPVLVWRLDQPEQVHRIDAALHAIWVR